jgi:hypothetical protein
MASDEGRRAGRGESATRSSGPAKKAAPGRKRAGGKRERASKGEVTEELPTELALGSDGRLYVNAEGVDPAKMEGRKMFRGFAMTREEVTLAVEEIHRMAFNVTAGVQLTLAERRKRKRSKKT